jgi:hypothetical protein
LLKARSIQELIVQSGERELLWQALRERASQSQSYSGADLPSIEIDPTLLAGLLGIRELEKKGRA